MIIKSRAVLDTNILVSALIARDNNSPPAKLYKAFKDQQYILVTSRLIMREIEEVLKREKIAIKYYVTDQRRKKIMQQLRELSVVTVDSLKVKLVEADPDDDKFFACAIEGGADYIVSGDKHLHAVGEYKGIKVVTPREFSRFYE